MPQRLVRTPSRRVGGIPQSLTRGSLLPCTLVQNAGMDLGRSLALAVLLVAPAQACGDGDDDGDGATTSRPSSSNSTSSPTTSPTGPAIDGSLDSKVDDARATLVRDEGVEPDEVTLVRAERVEWPDSSYGCPSLEGTYTPGPFPGYRIVLKAKKQDYIYMGADDTEPRRCLFLD